jgi:hypothetical protein
MDRLLHDFKKLSAGKIKIDSTPAVRPTMLQAAKRGARSVAQCTHNAKQNIQCNAYTHSATHFLHTHAETHFPYPVCQYCLFVGDTESVCVF